MKHKKGDKVYAVVTIRDTGYDPNTGGLEYYVEDWISASKTLTKEEGELMMYNNATCTAKHSEECTPAAVQNITISKAEYDRYIELGARVEVLKNYIENESYPSIDIIRIMLGIDK